MVLQPRQHLESQVKLTDDGDPHQRKVPPLTTDSNVSVKKTYQNILLVHILYKSPAHIYA